MIRYKKLSKWTNVSKLKALHGNKFKKDNFKNDNKITYYSEIQEFYNKFIQQDFKYNKNFLDKTNLLGKNLN